MAAWLVRLRSRLLLPANDPEAWAARVQAMATALSSLPQLGRDVFAWHGAVPPFGPAPIERTATTWGRHSKRRAFLR